MTLLVASLVDASIVLALALAATWLLRRRQAALRHALLAIAIVCALLMPVLEVLLPSVPFLTWDRGAAVQSSGLTLVAGDVDTAVSANEIEGAEPGVPWISVLAAAWLLGSMATLAGLLTGLVRLARLRRRCTPVTGRRRELMDALARACGVRRPIALLQSTDRSQLVTYGAIAPGIILPADAAHWSDDRWRIVLRHELAHITRHDAAIQITGELLHILQPLNPLVWIACRRLRQESEYACDDEVLADGVRATDYAAHLLDVAKHLSGRHPSWAAAPAIAHPSTLERRIVAMLQTSHNRAPLSRRAKYLAAAAALAVTLPLAAAGTAPAVVVLPAPPQDDAREAAPQESAATPAAAPTAVPAPTPARRPVAVPQAGSIAGQVVDQTGGTIPGVTVTLTDRQTSQAATALTDPAGRFVFRDLPAGDYTLTGTISGFTPFSASLTVTPGASLSPRFTIAVGTLSESVTVQCGPEAFSLVRAFFPVLDARQSTGTPIRVGGQVRPPKKIRDVKPTCPAGAGSDEVHVLLKGRIDESGTMAEVTLDDSESGTAPPAAFVTAALDAVRQWQFTPTELNGQAIEVGIRVRITFTSR